MGKRPSIFKSVKINLFYLRVHAYHMYGRGEVPPNLNPLTLLLFKDRQYFRLYSSFIQYIETRSLQLYRLLKSTHADKQTAVYWYV